MRYEIQRGICDLLRVELNDGEGVLAEVGKLIFMRERVTWNVVLPGHGFAGKLAAGFKRKIGGASVVLTEYAGPGEVGFSGDEPGTIRAVELAAGEEVIVRRGGFLAASPSVTLSVALVKRLRARLLAGHTLILQRVTGPGTLFVHAAGDFAAFTLGQGEVLRADTDSLVWFDASVSYSAAWGRRGETGLPRRGRILSVDLHGARARHAADDGPRARERAGKDGERLMPRPAREHISRAAWGLLVVIAAVVSVSAG